MLPLSLIGASDALSDRTYLLTKTAECLLSWLIFKDSGLVASGFTAVGADFRRESPGAREIVVFPVNCAAGFASLLTSVLVKVLASPFITVVLGTISNKPWPKNCAFMGFLLNIVFILRLNN